MGTVALLWWLCGDGERMGGTEVGTLGQMWWHWGGDSGTDVTLQWGHWDTMGGTILGTVAQMWWHRGDGERMGGTEGGHWGQMGCH